MGEFKRGYLYPRVMHSSTCSNELLLRFAKEDSGFMARFLHHDVSFTRCKVSLYILASVWTLGLLSGIWVFASADGSLLSLMRSAAYGSVSIVSLLIMTGLPFLFSAFAVYISCPWLVFPIAFCKGLCLSFVSLGILLSYGNGGWLMGFLVGFCDVVTLPLLYWFWRCCFRDKDPLWRCRCLITAAFLILAGSVEYSLIQPFLAGLSIL